jgi:hypothetical protein
MGAVGKMRGHDDDIQNGGMRLGHSSQVFRLMFKLRKLTAEYCKVGIW